MFDERSEHQELTTIHVLKVTVTCVLYPVTEKVLHQIFDPYGVNEICVLQQTTHANAFVEFQSWHEARCMAGASMIVAAFWTSSMPHHPSAYIARRWLNGIGWKWSHSLFLSLDQLPPPQQPSSTRTSTARRLLAHWLRLA
jgi:hypothetical protein